MFLWCEFLAGWAGMAGLVAGHPLDTIKVVQQQKCINIMDSIRQLYNRGGILGMGTPLITTGMLNAILFGCYENSLDAITRRKTDSQLELETDLYSSKHSATYGSHFVAGCIGGFFQLGLGCPVDVIKVQMQSRSRSTVRNSTQCIQQILEANGLVGLYKGITCHAWRDVPSSGIYFVVYEFSRRELSDIVQNGGKGVNFISGGIAGVISWWSTLPLDVIKSRLQGDSQKKPQYNGILQCASVILRANGIRGLFQGFREWRNISKLRILMGKMQFS